MEPTSTTANDQQQDYRISVRFGSAVLEAGHTSVPNLVLQHYAELKVSSAELVFMTLCLQHKWSKGNPHPSLGSIAKRMGVSRRQVRTYAAGLRAKQLLIVEERSDKVRGQLSSLYDFTPFLDAVVRLETATAETPGKDPSEGGRKFSSEGPGKDPSDPKEETEQEDSISSNSSNWPQLATDEPRTAIVASAAPPPPPRTGGSASLREIIANRGNGPVPPGATRLQTSASYLEASILEVSKAIGDTAEPASNVRRAKRLMLENGLDEASFVVCILRAQALLKERSRHGRRSVRRPGAYFFSILEGILDEIRAKKAQRGASNDEGATDVLLARKRAS